MIEKLSHAEVSRRGGLSKSAAKTTAARRNAKNARDILRAKRDVNAKKA